jgi:2-keto-4-pentenoate hydratase/2-oxohepta-3-ene-1,7-dioic acid hydratase in catechol pathway
MRFETIRTGQGDRLTIKRPVGNVAVGTSANLARALAELGSDGVLAAADAATERISGEFTNPRQRLQPGDVVVCAVERIGELRSPVRQA